MDNHNCPPLTSHLKDTNYYFSFYENLFKSLKTVHISELVEMIQSGTIRAQIEALRNETDPKKREEIKKGLPSVTVSGIFEKQRKADQITQYSGLIQLDFDKIENPREIINRLKNDKFVFVSFLSPSGNGVKVIAKVPSKKEGHLSYFKGLSRYFENNYQLNADPSCKDISRLMFLSYDPEINVNPASIEFELQLKPFSELVQIADKKLSFEAGKRNQYLFNLSCIARENGWKESDFLTECLAKYSQLDFDEKEIRTTVESGFKKTTDKTKETVKRVNKIHQVEEFLLQKFEFRRNEVKMDVEYRPKATNEPFTAISENNLYRLLLHNDINYPFNRLMSLLGSDFIEPHDPFQSYFDSLGEWKENEPDYIGELLSFLIMEDQERFNRHFRKMLVRTVACALDPKVFNKQAFILVHDKQNSGKSTFCRWLCPPALENYRAENVNPNDKDSLIALTNSFLINLDELSGFTKSDINSMKSFLSKDAINVRLPYDRKPSNRIRRASFVGSTNREDFLTDETGSVRWLCFKVVKILFGYRTAIDINNVWKQSFTLFKSGFEYEMTQEEVMENEIVNGKFQLETIEEQKIRDHFRKGHKDHGSTFMTATDVAEAIARETALKIHPPKIGTALKKLGFIQSSGIKNGFSVRGYYVDIIQKSLT